MIACLFGLTSSWFALDLMDLIWFVLVFSWLGVFVLYVCIVIICVNLMVAL